MFSLINTYHFCYFKNNSVAIIMKFIKFLRFESITLFKESRRSDALAISISFPSNNTVTGTVNSRTDLVRTNVAIKSKEESNL